jgi:hydrogenase expression/formation protein HypC
MYFPPARHRPTMAESVWVRRGLPCVPGDPLRAGRGKLWNTRVFFCRGNDDELGVHSMCLAIPVQVIEVLEQDQAIADVGGVRKEISLALVDGVQVGDYVILHVGYALNRLDPAEAQRTIEMFAQAGMGLVEETP